MNKMKRAEFYDTQDSTLFYVSYNLYKMLPAL